MTGSRCLIPFDRREGMTVAAAAKRSGYVARTIRTWCEARDIGRHVGSPGAPWTVSRVALAMLLDGDEAALAFYLAGDRSSPAVVHYYEREGLGGLIRDWHERGVAPPRKSAHAARMT